MKNLTFIIILLAVVLYPPVNVLADNYVPIASAGPDQTVIAGEFIRLQGNAFDPDGENISSWQWTIESSPDGSAPYISDSSAQHPLFQSAMPGAYVLALIASDGTNNSEPDFNTIYVSEKLNQFRFTYEIGLPIRSLAVEDFSGDGIDDVVATAGGSFFRILLGNGDGTLASPAEITGLYSSDGPVLVEDFNGDGKLDLASGWNHDNIIQILLGRGDGTFVETPIYNVLSDLVLLESALMDDFNNDGIVDFAVLEDNRNVIRIYLGNGDGTFGQVFTTCTMGTVCYQSTGIAYSSELGEPGYGFNSFITGDINMDGISDIVVANYAYLGSGIDYISVLLGNGDGSFRNVADYPIGVGRYFWVWGMRIADFNRDGKPDLAGMSSYRDASDETVREVLILPGNGDGTFETSLALSYIVDHSPSIAVNDLNGDNIVDLVLVHEYIDKVSILLGNIDGTFSAPTQYAMEDGPRDVSLGDFNADGIPDLAVGHYHNSPDKAGLTVLLGIGDGTFGKLLPLANAGRDQTILVGEKAYLCGTAIDREGKQIVSWQWTIYSAPANSDSSLSDPSSPNTTILADFAGDYILSLVVSNGIDVSLPDYVTIRVEPKPSQNVCEKLIFGTSNYIRDLLGLPIRSLAVDDFSGDGIDDVVATAGGSFFRILLGNGDGTLASPAEITGLYSSDGPVLVEDFNGDGKLDLASGWNHDNIIQILLGRGDGTFVETPIYNVLSDLVLLESALMDDFNNDGIVDFAVLEDYRNVIRIYLGNGDGTFGQVFTTCTMGTVCYQSTGIAYSSELGEPGYGFNSFITGDINMDGISDIVVANYAYLGSGIDYISVLLGNGDGSFRNVADYPIGVGRYFWIWGMRIADFNRDGKPDLAGMSSYRDASDETVREVLILPGNGDGTFETSLALSYIVDHSPSIAVNDLNGDNIVDLVLVHEYIDKVSILLGNIDGTFSAPTQYAMEDGPRDVSLGDFNADGIPDLAVGHYHNSPDKAGLTVLPGNGDGSFGISLALSYIVDHSPSIAVNDLNGDNIVDLVLVHEYIDKVSILLGNIDGTFSAPTQYAMEDGPRDVSLGDFNADGIPDLAVGHYHNSPDKAGLTVLLGIGDGSFDTSYSAYLLGLPIRSLAVDDFSGDGIDDVVATAGGSFFRILLGNGDGTLASPAEITGLYSSDGPVLVEDFNGDGKLDLASGWNHDNIIQILLGRGDGTFVETPIYNVLSDLVLLESALMDDFNNDGIVDFAVLEDNRNVIRIYLGNGDGTFGQVFTTCTMGTVCYQSTGIAYSSELGEPGYGFNSFITGDINMDGISDIVVANYAYLGSGIDYISVLLGNGDGSFRNVADYPIGVGRYFWIWGMRIADFNRDGKPDLAGMSSYRDASDETVREVLILPNKGCAAPVEGDLDTDGDVDRDDLDIILAARNTPAEGPNDPRDLDGDGMITGLDARKLITLCTRPRCATE